jgi:HD-like signal output (HDOD) protein
MEFAAMAKAAPTLDEGSLEPLGRSRIDTLAYLPTSLAVAMKFVALGKNRDADPADYVRVISADSSLVTKILSLANSSWFGIRNRVTRLLVLSPNRGGISCPL